MYIKLILWHSFHEILRGVCFPQNVKNHNDIHFAVYYIKKLLMRKFSEKTFSPNQIFLFLKLTLHRNASSPDADPAKGISICI